MTEGRDTLCVIVCTQVTPGVWVAGEDMGLLRGYQECQDLT